VEGGSKSDSKAFGRLLCSLPKAKTDSAESRVKQSKMFCPLDYGESFFLDAVILVILVSNNLFFLLSDLCTVVLSPPSKCQFLKTCMLW
jgi:hypothetical protein